MGGGGGGQVSDYCVAIATEKNAVLLWSCINTRRLNLLSMCQFKTPYAPLAQFSE
jgi:hypothetical protein